MFGFIATWPMCQFVKITVRCNEEELLFVVAGSVAGGDVRCSGPGRVIFGGLDRWRLLVSILFVIVRIIGRRSTCGAS
jgi:hypothetical protein